MDFVSWDDDIPNIWKNKKCSKPPTSHGLPCISFSLGLTRIHGLNHPIFLNLFLTCLWSYIEISAFSRNTLCIDQNHPKSNMFINFFRKKTSGGPKSPNFRGLPHFSPRKKPRHPGPPLPWHQVLVPWKPHLAPAEGSSRCYWRLGRREDVAHFV